MLNVLYSADYELFLGESFLPEREVLVEPAAALLDTCDAIGIPVTLFCDVACLWRYREEGDDDFPAAAEAQLRDALRRGHDVQAHLHPHWLSARREGRRWIAPPETFLVGSLTQDQVATLLARTSSYLASLLRPVDPEYACVAFRAGNYGLQPNDREVLAALRETGYAVDSSVVPELVLRNGINAVDFRDWPERSGPIDGILEIPIPSARLGLVEVVRNRLSRPPLPAPRGATIQETGGGVRTSLLRKLFRRLAWLELGPDPRPLIAITRRYLERVGTDVSFAFSCHPKTVGERELEVLRAYHEWLASSYEVRAVTFREAACGLPSSRHPASRSDPAEARPGK